MTKTVYAYDKEGKFIGKRTLDDTDRSPISGAWQIPANVTESKPPVKKEGYDRYYRGGKWEEIEIPQEMPREKTLGELKAEALNKAYLEFVKRRDAITWVKREGVTHGYDRQTEDITNFTAAMKRAELGASVHYNVYVNGESNKDFIEHTKEMFYETLNQSADEQIKAYLWFKEIKGKIESTDSKETLGAVMNEP